MLEKITNINLKSEFFNGKKGVTVYKNSAKSHTLKSELHDSVYVSSAYRFLSQIEWQLKEITSVSAEKIYVAFYYSGFEFQTTLDVSNFAKLNKLIYHIIENPGEGDLGKINSASLSVSINKQKSESLGVLTELRGIKTMFFRLTDLHIKEELNFNSDILYELFDGILESISQEFDYINACLFSFVEKILKIKPLNNNSTATSLPVKDLSSKIKLLNVDSSKL